MIKTNKVNFLEVFANNRFEITLVFSDISLINKAMKMQVRLRPDTEAVLTFSTDDNSITKQVVDTKVEITLLRNASVMDIPARNYLYDLWVWNEDDTESVETLLVGRFEVINNITQIENEG